MSPEQFSRHLATLMTAATALCALPLTEMAAYCEHVEALGQEVGADWTPERESTTAHIARMIAAVEHLRSVVAMGGAA